MITRFVRHAVVLCALLALSAVVGCGSKEVTITPPENQNPVVKKGVEQIMQRRQQQQQQLAPSNQPPQNRPQQ